MKKIILVLMFSLGLVNVANAESVCNSYSIDDSGIGDDMSYFDGLGTNEAAKHWNKLIVRYHTAEIKKSDKETLCIYMTQIGQGYLNIQLTPQEIERFERFLVEVNSDGYEAYERNKDSLLKVLKFFKYYNKLDSIYSRERIGIYYNREGHYFPPYNSGNLAMVDERLRNYEKNKAYVIIKKFIYDKNMGDYLPSHPYDTLPRSIKELKDMDNQDAKNIAKWAESKIKESKQKDSK